MNYRKIYNMVPNSFRLLKTWTSHYNQHLCQPSIKELSDLVPAIQFWEWNVVHLPNLKHPRQSNLFYFSWLIIISKRFKAESQFSASCMPYKCAWIELWATFSSNVPLQNQRFRIPVTTEPYTRLHQPFKILKDF